DEIDVSYNVGLLVKVSVLMPGLHPNRWKAIYCHYLLSPLSPSFLNAFSYLSCMVDPDSPARDRSRRPSFPHHHSHGSPVAASLSGSGLKGLEELSRAPSFLPGTVVSGNGCGHAYGTHWNPSWVCGQYVLEGPSRPASAPGFAPCSYNGQ